MYRICLARSGYYYVQMGNHAHDGVWRKVSPFFRFQTTARRWVRLRKGLPFRPVNVVEYL